MIAKIKKYHTFAPTVHTTLPVRTASQGVSFAFIALRNPSFSAPYVY